MFLPFGWIYFGEKLQPIRYYKIESPSELYATVVHPQIELKKHQMRVPKANGFSQKRNYAMGNVDIAGYIPKTT
jgi:hypothetical protein